MTNAGDYWDRDDWYVFKHRFSIFKVYIFGIKYNNCIIKTYKLGS